MKNLKLSWLRIDGNPLQGKEKSISQVKKPRPRGRRNGSKAHGKLETKLNLEVSLYYPQ